MLEHDYLCYDITSMPSYAENNEYVKYGYNRDKEPLPQINLAMLFGQNSRLPAYYRRIPGNINDVATLKTTMQALDFLGVAGINFVLDRGFYSELNIDELFRRRHKFTIAVPAGRQPIICNLPTMNRSSCRPYCINGAKTASVRICIFVNAH